MDITVTYPSAGRIHFHSSFLFADPGNELCQEFVRRVIDGAGVLSITIKSAKSSGGRRTRTREPVAEVQYCVKSRTRRQAVEEIYGRLLGAESGPQHFFYNNSPNGAGDSNRTPKRPLFLIPDHQGVVRLYRHGPVITSWQVKHEVPGRIRLYHPSLHRRKEVCQAIERELMSVLGIDNYKTSPLTATALVNYSPKKIRREQIIEILDRKSTRLNSSHRT